jgi:trigger factor
MATVERISLGPQHEKISVTIVPEDYTVNFEKSLKQYSKQANIPGFRKGMVPTSLIKKMHGEGVFQEEVLKSADKAMQDYFEAEKIDFFAQPLPIDEKMPEIAMSNPTEYNFNFEIGLRPTYKVADLEKGSFNNYKIIVTDEMLDKELENLQKKNSNLVEVTEIKTDNDNVTVMLKASQSEGEAKEVGVPVSYFKENFRSNLIGKGTQHEFAFTLNEAFDTTEQNFIKKELDIDKRNETASDANYEATIVAIKTPEVPELNEAFFEQNYPGKEVKTLAGFRDELKKDVEAYFSGVGKGAISDQVFKYWVDNTEVELPETFLKNWMEKGQEKPVSKENVEAEYPKFASSLKWTLISNDIAKDNNITVDNEDLKKHAINQLFNYYGGAMGMDTEADWVQDFANNMLKDKKFVNDAAERIVQEKIFDWAETKVKLTDKEVTLEEFEAIRASMK